MEAARRKRHPIGHRWSVDETYVKVAGEWRYVYRAIDEDGQVVDVLLRERRDTAAAVAFFEQALETVGVRPEVVTTDKAAAYPPAVAQVLPEAEHLTGTLEQQRIERVHGHVKSRLRSMRWFKTWGTAALFCRVHGFLRNLLQGFYAWGIVLGDPRRPQAPRLMRAWAELTHARRLKCARWCGGVRVVGTVFGCSDQHAPTAPISPPCARFVQGS
jgi:transposase, IS6 family